MIHTLMKDTVGTLIKYSFYELLDFINIVEKHFINSNGVIFLNTIILFFIAE